MPEYCTVSGEVGSRRYSGGAVQQKKYNIDSVRILRSGIKKIFFVLVKTMAWSVLVPEYCIVSRGVGSRSQYADVAQPAISGQPLVYCCVL